MNKNKNKFAENFLKITLKILKNANKGTPIDSLLDETRGTLESKAASDCIFQYFRHKGIVDYSIEQVLTKKTKNKFKDIIKIALVQALYQNGINAFAAVDCAVTFSKKKYGKNIAGLINATLRSLLSVNFDEMINNAPEYVKFNIPEVVLKKWTKQFDYNTIKGISQAIQEQPQTSFRILKQDISINFEEFNCEKIKLPQWADEYDFYQTNTPSVIFKNNWLDKALVYIQDPATVSPASFYQTKPNDIILDLCAAPGGKSMAILEKIETGLLIASDSSYLRQKRTAENLKNYIISNKAFICISSASNPAFQDNIADCIILDVPCSNTGVARKRPDALWNFSLQKLNRLLTIQQDILQASASLLKQGGTLIYSTCSIEEEENRSQVNTFIQENQEFTLVDERLLIPNKTHDGGYSALLVKST